MSDELVKVEYWWQETMESGRWIIAGPMKRSVAEEGIESGIFTEGEIVPMEESDD